MAQDVASVLFGVPGLRVTDADRRPDGTLEVWAVSEGSPGPVCCPACGTPSARVHGQDVIRPQDVRWGGQPVDLNVVKRRLTCENADCKRKTFTETIEAVPPRGRLAGRLRDQWADAR